MWGDKHSTWVSKAPYAEKKELKKSVISISAHFPKFGWVIYLEYNNKFDFVPSNVQMAIIRLSDLFLDLLGNEKDRSEMLWKSHVTAV